MDHPDPVVRVRRRGQSSGDRRRTDTVSNVEVFLSALRPAVSPCSAPLPGRQNSSSWPVSWLPIHPLVAPSRKRSSQWPVGACSAAPRSTIVLGYSGGGRTGISPISQRASGACTLVPRASLKGTWGCPVPQQRLAKVGLNVYLRRPSCAPVMETRLI